MTVAAHCEPLGSNRSQLLWALQLCSLVPVPCYHPLQRTGSQAPSLRVSEPRGVPTTKAALLFRVKFLVMSAKGPVAETKWSKDIYLQQGMRTQGQLKRWGGAALRDLGTLGSWGK